MNIACLPKNAAFLDLSICGFSDLGIFIFFLRECSKGRGSEEQKASKKMSRIFFGGLHPALYNKSCLNRYMGKTENDNFFIFQDWF